MLDVPDVAPGEAQVRDATTGDAVLPRNELTIAFGDGDTGKSMVALLLGAIMQTGRTDLAGLDVLGGRPIRVAYAKQPLTYAQLADLLDADAKVVAETCRRGLGTTFTKVPSEGREIRIGLPTAVRDAVLHESAGRFAVGGVVQLEPARRATGRRGDLLHRWTRWSRGS